MSLGEYLGSGSGITKGLYHLNGSSADYSGNGNNGTDTAITYSLANGKFGQGALFTRASSSKINLGTSPITGSSSRTISFWTKINSFNNNTTFFGQGTLTTGNAFYIYTTTNQNVGVGVYGSANVVTGNTVLTTGTWYHIAVTYTGTSSISTTNTKIYINGVPKTTTGSDSATVNTSATGYYIGARMDGAADYMDGSIDEFIIENVAWSAEKVKKYYTYAKGRFNQ